ncbi:MAG: hypothetical protein ABII82_07320, partial [Verrucomicrobiota bacterium]
MKNFLLRFVLPPAYAVGLLTAFALFQANDLADLAAFTAIALIYAYIFAGLPALAFAGIMGRLQRRGFRHGGVRLLAAMLLGFAAGFAIGLVFNGQEPFTLFLPLGVATGLLVELTVI